MLDAIQESQSVYMNVKQNNYMDNNEKIAIIALIFSLGPVFALILLPLLFLGVLISSLSFLFMMLPPLGIILGIISTISLSKTNSPKRKFAIIAIVIGFFTTVMTLGTLSVMLNPELAASYLPE